MALEPYTSAEHETEGGCRSRALPSSVRSSTADQHQTRLAGTRPRSLPAAVNQLQACELGRGDLPPVLSRISHWSLLPATDRRVFKSSLLSIRLNSRVRAVNGCASPFHSSTVIGSRRSALNTLAHEQVFQCLSHALHFHHRLSSFAVSVGIDPNENGLTHEYKSLPPRGKAHV